MFFFVFLIYFILSQKINRISAYFNKKEIASEINFFVYPFSTSILNHQFHVLIHVLNIRFK